MACQSACFRLPERSWTALQTHEEKESYRKGLGKHMNSANKEHAKKFLKEQSSVGHSL